MKSNLCRLFTLGLLGVLLTGGAPMAFAGKGGSSGNGPGGENSAKDIIPMGLLGAVVAAQSGPRYDSLMKEYMESNPGRPVVRCGAGDTGALYPKLPERLGKYFEFSQVPVDIVNFFRGWKHKPIGENLCGDLKLLRAFGTFSISLNLIELEDPITTHLIEKIAAGGQKISVLLRTSPKKLKYIGGKIAEYASYDHATDELIWAEPPQCNGFLCFVRRRERLVLRHELLHMLLKRTLGSEYPNEKYWHDVRYEAQHGWNDDWVKAKTSANAAFVEGMANAIERDGGVGNDWVLEPHNFNTLHQKKDTNKLCYWSPGEFYIKSDGMLAPRIDNEFFVSSAINMLFVRTEATPYEPGKDIDNATSVHRSFHGRRMIAFIDAIAQFKPRNVIELAVAFDKQTGEDLGYRMLRELFYYDYKTRQVTDGELEHGEIWPGRKTICVRAENPQGFLTPLLEQEEAAALDAGRRSFAAAIQAKEVLNQVQSSLKDAEHNIEKLGGEQTFKESETLKYAYSSRFDEKTMFETNSLYRAVMRLEHIEVSEGAIMLLVREGQQKKPSDVWSTLTKALSKAREVQEALQKDTQGGAEHITVERLMQAIDAREKLNSAVFALRDHGAICRTLKAVAAL